MFLKTVYVNLSSLGTMVILARLVTPAEFGIVALAAVFISIVTLLTDLGLTPTLIRIKSPTQVQLNTAFWISFSTSIMLAGVLFFVAPICASILHQERLSAILRVLATQIPLSGLRLVPLATLTRAMRFKTLALREVLAETGSTAVAIYLAFSGYGAWALVAQSVGTVVIDVAVLWIAVPWAPRIQFSIREAKEQLRFGFAVLGTLVLRTTRDRVGDLLVAAFLGTTPLGIWTIGNRIATICLELFSSVVSTISLPALTHVRGDATRLHTVFRRAVRTCTGLALPAMLGLATVSASAVPLVFGHQWTGSIHVAELAALTAAAASVSWLDSTLWWTIGKAGVELKLTLVISLMQILAVVVSAPFGIIPLAFALLARNLVTIPGRIWCVTRIAKVPIDAYRDIPGTLIACIPMMLAAAATRHLLSGTTAFVQVVLSVAFGAATYVVASWWTQKHALLELITSLTELARPQRPSA